MVVASGIMLRALEPSILRKQGMILYQSETISRNVLSLVVGSSSR